MTPRKRHWAPKDVWALARRQHGVVAHRQLRALGLSDEAIRHRVATARLHRLWPRVYAVGRPEVDRCGWWMAATLACGPGAVLSDRSAAELWQMLKSHGGVIHVSVTGAGGRRLADIHAHRRSLPESDVTETRGIRVTTPVRTLVDIAPRLGRPALEAVINEADKRDLVDPEQLRAEIDARKGQRGARVLRRLLDHHALVLTDSELERLFVPIAQRAGLPQPETQAWLQGFRVDFYFRELGLVAETDGLRYHRTPAQQARDRVRDQALTAAGLTVLRFTHAQVKYEPGYVERILRSAGSSGPRRPRAA